MMTDEERRELHRQLEELQQQEERMIWLAEAERYAALRHQPRQYELVGAPTRMR